MVAKAKKEHIFVFALLVYAVLPLIPLLLDFLATKSYPRVQTILIISIVYSLTTACMPESTFRWAGFGLIYAVIAAVEYGMLAKNPNQYRICSAEILVAMGVLIFWFALAWALLYDAYVLNKKSLWGVESA